MIGIKRALIGCGLRKGASHEDYKKFKFLKVKHYLPCTLDHKCHFQQLQLIQIFQPDPKMVSPMRRWRLKFIAQCKHLSYIARELFDLLLLLFLNGTDM